MPASLNVFPNPFTDQLFIDLPTKQLMTGPLAVKVFDPLGRMIFSQIIGTLQSKSVNLSSLSQGLYYIIITANGQLYTKAILKTLK